MGGGGGGGKRERNGGLEGGQGAYGSNKTCFATNTTRQFVWQRGAKRGWPNRFCVLGLFCAETGLFFDGRTIFLLASAKKIIDRLFFSWFRSAFCRVRFLCGRVISFFDGPGIFLAYKNWEKGFVLTGPVVFLP